MQACIGGLFVHTGDMPKELKLVFPINPIEDTAEERSQRIQCFFDAYADGYSITASAEIAGVSRGTWYKWVKHDSQLSERWDEAKHALIGQAEDVLRRCWIKAADDPRYITALIFYLKAKGGYSDAPNTVINAVMPSITYHVDKDTK